MWNRKRERDKERIESYEKDFFKDLCDFSYFILPIVNYFLFTLHYCRVVKILFFPSLFWVSCRWLVECRDFVCQKLCITDYRRLLRRESFLERTGSALTVCVAYPLSKWIIVFRKFFRGLSSSKLSSNWSSNKFSK